MNGSARVQLVEAIHAKTEGWSEEALFRLAEVLRRSSHSPVLSSAARAAES